MVEMEAKVENNVKPEAAPEADGANAHPPQEKGTFSHRGGRESRFGRGGRFGGPRGGGGNRDGGDRGQDGARNQEGGGGPHGGRNQDGGGRMQDGRNQDGPGPRRGGRGGGRGGYQGHRRGDNNQQDGDNDNREGGGRGRFPPRGPDDKFNEKVMALSGPTFDIPAVPMTEKKFNGRNRLYIGNIGPEVTEDDLKELFQPFGEINEIFINKEKNFGFIKVDYHSNAEKAKRELDGHVLKGRNLKIRFAPNSTTIKVKNLTPFVSNELLYLAFSVFGEIERAMVCVDERGKPTGEGIIDYARKGSATHALRRCSDGCFFLTGSLRPAIVETYEVVDDVDGYPEKNIPKKSMDYHKEREQGPRFAAPGSFENEYGMRWKQLYDLHSQKEEALKKELELEKEKLEAQMEYAKYEHETEVLRDQLRAREMDKERQKIEWERKQRMVEEERLRTEEQMRRNQEEMESRILAQQEELRRRQQENTLFMQAHNLDSMLEQQEQAYDTPSSYSKLNAASMNDETGIDSKSFMSSYERHSNRYEGNREPARGNTTSLTNRGHWVSDNRRTDDFPNKRRRF